MSEFSRDMRIVLAAGAGFFLAAPAAQGLLAYLLPEPALLPESAPQALHKIRIMLGVLIMAAGFMFCLWANTELWLRGRGFAAVIGKVKLTQESTRLVTTGPYALCRNPMHTGIIVFLLGSTLCFNSFSALLVPAGMFVFALALALFADEPRLRRDFPQEYAQWAQRVPRFVPRLHQNSRSDCSRP